MIELDLPSAVVFEPDGFQDQMEAIGVAELLRLFQQFDRNLAVDGKILVDDLVFPVK